VHYLHGVWKQNEKVYTGHTQKNCAVLKVLTIKTAPFFCVCPVYGNARVRLSVQRKVGVVRSSENCFFLGAFAILRKPTSRFVMSVCLSLRPHATARLPWDGFT
jgi:Zn-finger protein